MKINIRTLVFGLPVLMVLCFVQGVVKIAAVNADEHQSLGGQYQIQGFPTIKVFGANKNSPSDYQGIFYTAFKCLYQYQIICITFQNHIADYTGTCGLRFSYNDCRSRYG